MSDKLCAVVGVGSGMGQAIARVFAKGGYDLALISRNPLNMESYKKEVEEIGQKANLYSADVTDSATVKTAFKNIIKELGVPDAVIYNIATMTLEKPSELTEQTVCDTLPLNFFGALHTTAAILPAMRERGSGALIYTGGGFAIEPHVERTSHSVGKAALRNWVYGLFKELTPEGIHAATVTITRPIEAGTLYDPDLIASNHLKLAGQKGPDWDWEIIHKEL
ncbi:MAG: SDR family NAD(P)-dependent oxidoreductase [Dethiobacteria bacterium]